MGDSLLYLDLFFSANYLHIAEFMSLLCPVAICPSFINNLVLNIPKQFFMEKRRGKQPSLIGFDLIDLIDLIYLFDLIHLIYSLPN